MAQIAAAAPAPAATTPPSASGQKPPLRTTVGAGAGGAFGAAGCGAVGGTGGTAALAPVSGAASSGAASSGAASSAICRGLAAGIGLAELPSIVESMGTEGGMRELTGASAVMGLDRRTGLRDAAFFSPPSPPVELALDEVLFLPDVATSYPPEWTAVGAVC